MKKNKLKILILVLFIAISLFLLIFFQLEPDYFWHVKAGEYMFKNGVLTHDVFSWFVSGKYWMSHEWLFEIILYGFKLVFGKMHPYIYSFVCILSLLLIIFNYNKKNITKNIPYTLMYIALLVFLSLVYIQARPHMLSFSFIALTIYLLYDLYKNENSKKVFFLPLITILWANVHGGSSNLSYIFGFIFLFSGLFSFKFKKFEATRITKKQIYKYILIIVLCMISICINIHGFKMFIYPYENMLDSTMLNNISEWQPTSLTNIYYYSYYFFLIIVIIFMFFGDRKVRFIDLILFLFTAFLGIKSVRFWLYCPIVMSFVVFDYFEERKLDKGTYAIITILIIGLLGGFLFKLPSMFKIKYNFYVSDKAIKIIKEEKPERLYNMYNYGGELVYNEIPVFIDGRADLYSKYNYKDYLDISECKKNYEELIKKYDFDYFLVDREYPIFNYINNNDDYTQIYINKNLAIYKKTVN